MRLSSITCRRRYSSPTIRVAFRQSRCFLLRRQDRNSWLVESSLRWNFVHYDRHAAAAASLRTPSVIHARQGVFKRIRKNSFLADLKSIDYRHNGLARKPRRVHNYTILLRVGLWRNAFVRLLFSRATPTFPKYVPTNRAIVRLYSAREIPRKSNQTAFGIETCRVFFCRIWSFNEGQEPWLDSFQRAPIARKAHGLVRQLILYNILQAKRRRGRQFNRKIINAAFNERESRSSESVCVQIFQS